MAEQPEGRTNRTAYKTVVWSDDNPGFHEVVALLLEDEPITVLSTTDPAEAATLLERPDVCLYVTNPSTGWDLAQRIKADPRRRRIPILLCTASCLGVDEDHIEETPFDRVLFKPFRPEQLLEVIQAMTGEGE